MQCSAQDSLGMLLSVIIFFFQAEDGIRDVAVTGVQTCALPISNHAAANVGSVANARAPRNDAHFIGSRESPNRISGFVEERLFGGVNGHVRDGTQAKAKKDSLLHPGVDAPTGFRRGVGLRRANFAAVQCRLKITEQPVMFLFVVLRRLVEKSFNERWLHAISRGQAPRSRVGPAPATPVPRGCARDFPLLAALGAGATPARATPFPPAPLSPEDRKSTRLTPVTATSRMPAFSLKKKSQRGGLANVAKQHVGLFYLDERHI